MNLSVYVGPYLVLPRDFNWREWESIVADGRMEAKEDGGELMLVPSVDLPGIDRQLRFGRNGETPVVAIHSGHVVAEIRALTNLTDRLLRHCRGVGIPVCVQWGIVPCWS